MPGRFHLYPFKTGEILRMKKPHPCGSFLWQVERAGAEITLKCLTCGRVVQLTRAKLEKAVKSVQDEPMIASGSAVTAPDAKKTSPAGKVVRIAGAPPPRPTDRNKERNKDAERT